VLGHLPALDGVRGIAVLLVVAGHVGSVLNPANNRVAGGFDGVVLFFVLSGFLITSLLLQERRATGAVSLGRFYARRALRLLPALMALLVVDFAYGLEQGRPFWREAAGLTWVQLYASNIALSFHRYVPVELFHTWSLAVEEQFYLLWPAALLAIFWFRSRAKRETTRTVPVALWVVLVSTVIVRAVLYRKGYGEQAYTMLYSNGDALIIGCMLAFMYQRGSSLGRRSNPTGWVGLAVLCAGGRVFYGGFALLAIAGAALIASALSASGPLNAVLSWRPLTLVGRVSYGLYLWHPLVLTILARHPDGMSRFEVAIVGLTISALATIASWVVIERPALQLKRHFTAPSTRNRVAGEAQA
jgi:peptidoglycan/LPS O-acetylase OafA/YrhL